jgi:hypothetical protein
MIPKVLKNLFHRPFIEEGQRIQKYLLIATFSECVSVAYSTSILMCKTQSMNTLNYSTIHSKQTVN